MLMNAQDYFAVVEQVKQEIKTAQYKAAYHANAELILLYYHIGCVINAHKSWGSNFVENLSRDLKRDFRKRRDIQLEI